MYKVVLPDGQETNPVDMPTLVQWAVEGRIHAETTIVDLDTAYRFRAADHPHLQSRVAAVPVLLGNRGASEAIPEEALNPWTSMLTRPRQTIHQIIATNPTYGVLLLTILSGFTEIDADMVKSLRGNMSLGLALLCWAILTSLISVLSLYLGGAVFRWTGSWLGGRADYREVRAAMAWSSLPEVYLLPATLILSLVPFLDSATASGPYAGVQETFTTVGMFWSVLLMCKALGEVHGFSAGKGFGALLLGLLILAIPVAIGFVVYGAMIGAR
jgi:hypothetical protein